MTILIHAEIHGLVGRASELRDVLRDHAEQLARAEGSLGAAAYEPLGRSRVMRPPAAATPHAHTVHTAATLLDLRHCAWTARSRQFSSLLEEASRHDRRGRPDVPSAA